MAVACLYENECPSPHHNLEVMNNQCSNTYLTIWKNVGLRCGANSWLETCQDGAVFSVTHKRETLTKRAHPSCWQQTNADWWLVCGEVTNWSCKFVISRQRLLQTFAWVTFGINCKDKLSETYILSTFIMIYFVKSALYKIEPNGTHQRRVRPTGVESPP